MLIFADKQSVQSDVLRINSKMRSMKRLILTIVLASVAICVYGQPRAIGIRFGVTGLEASYEHSINKLQFVEGNMGIDFGNKVNGMPGIKAEGTYNIIWARPAWTNKGSWAIFSGPGAAIGYVNDEVHFKSENEIISFEDNGFMLGISVQVGLEYTFWFPLQISLDLRPMIGMHVNGGTYQTRSGIEMPGYGTRIGFYDNGLMGFVPSLSFRYRF